MSEARVKRSVGPKSKMTKATYRKKALEFLLKDFQGHCAYCLDPDSFRHPSQDQVDHFDCKLKGRRRHQYKNLMLACPACNLCKRDKPIRNPLDREQRLLNCTVENEFPGHIIERDDGQWEAVTKEGEYHLESIGLTELCHKNKRFARRVVVRQFLNLCTGARQYLTFNPAELQRAVMELLRSMLDTLDHFPPLITEQGAITARNWLKAKGVDVGLFDQPRAPLTAFSGTPQPPSALTSSRRTRSTGSTP